ncbi:MAG: hypothetical protein IPN77_03795 [Sandaracinaceae bacterium]|nr:hypothetical protein [Sandaracinaceae bacterium]
MQRSPSRFALALVLTLLGAPVARADQPADPADPARPVNRCQIAGQHVSGVVSVDLGDGRHAELTLVDVGAIVAMAPALNDVLVYVNAPMSFSGRFVSRDLGGPAAYVARTYRSPDGGLQLAPSVPFEITLGSDPSMASVRLPRPSATGRSSSPCRVRSCVRVPRAPTRGLARWRLALACSRCCPAHASSRSQALRAPSSRAWNVRLARRSRFNSSAAWAPRETGSCASR